MKNKLILTSLLAMVVASPAFAVSAADDGSGFIGTNEQTTDCKELDDGPLTYLGDDYNDGTFTLEAQWAAKSYDVKYFCASGDTDPKQTDIVSWGETGYDLDLSNAATQCGVNCGTYDGVKCFLNGVSPAVEVDTTYTASHSVDPWNIDNNVDCTVLWKYKVDYTCGSGSGNGTSNQGPYSPTASVTTLSAATGCTAPANSEFSGWKCGSAVNNNALITAGGTFTMPGQCVECTAQWSVCPTGQAPGQTGSCEDVDYTLTYVAGDNNATGSTAGTTFNYQDDDVTLAVNGFAVDGKHFTGWSCDNSIGSHQPGYTIPSMPAANVECTAQWENNPTVTYETNNCGGQDVTITNAVNYGSTYNVLAYNSNALSGLIGAHKVWDKWQRNGTDFNAATISNVTSNITLTAVCKNQVTLLWKENAADNDPYQNQCTYGVANDIAVPSAPTAPTGYEFSGWKVVDHANYQ